MPLRPLAQVLLSTPANSTTAAPVPPSDHPSLLPIYSPKARIAACVWRSVGSAPSANTRGVWLQPSRTRFGVGLRKLCTRTTRASVGVPGN
ncbi:hypothetical protein BO78DRAFT_211243 [Aspergillus sclerotiicarbonarius CBS 121057]|uniref:Uncharacterized protein n=1 Tax=Aspergillus sclerotiicarbonarius (strain CBS 121057 / IBT 28362) TaxID=1448318 RepID=A0A319DYG0_ASPSB|nr:hypothetical protein BO78DRAFT_211243 [Aspergillus sclerotiicarbonarius CBS 121057]